MKIKQGLLAVFVCILIISSYFVLSTYDNSDHNIGGDSTGAEGGNIATIKEFASGSTSHLTIKSEIICIDSKRSPTGKGVYFEEGKWFDGTYDPLISGISWPVSFLNEGISWSPEPTLEMNIPNYINNIFFYRYEGKTWPGDTGITNCRIFVDNTHLKNPLEKSAINAYIPYDYYSYKTIPSDIVLESVFNYTVDWDNNKTACELLGGDWLDNGEAGISDASQFGNSLYGAWRCCGDDWIWVYNKPAHYVTPASAFDSSLNTRAVDPTNPLYPLCLYFNVEDGVPLYGGPISINGRDYSEGYRCSMEGNPNRQYDPSLYLDDPGEDIGARKDGFPYFFAGVRDKETDVGKWSDKDGGNAIFCGHSFENAAGKGEVFKWNTISEAADKNQLTCNIYLGYPWTGTKCCRGTDTYNDIATECNATLRAIEIYNSGSGPEPGSPDFEKSFTDACNGLKILNSACFEGNAVQNKSIISSKESPGKKEVYSENGILYFCNRTIGSQINPTFDHVEKCTIKGPSHTDFAVCTYKNDSWADELSTSISPPCRTATGGAKCSVASKQNLTNSLHTSSLPAEALALSTSAAFQPTECCILNGCWNGTTCVNDWSTYMIYESNWSLYSRNLDAGKEKTSPIFTCRSGEWLKTEPKYNWYNQDKPNFCTKKFSCYCIGKDSSAIDYCGPANVENDCTNTSNFFINDHFCQAVYDGNENIIDSKWTSRTKFLAEQLMKLSGSFNEGTRTFTSDFTLFCDNYVNSLNYIEPIIASLPNINAFCVLNSSLTGTVLGVSFNTDTTKPSYVVMNGILFNEINGFVNMLPEDNLITCDNAIKTADSSKYGSFRKCSTANNKVWYNNKTIMLIYSKAGITGDELPKPIYSSYDAMFNSNVDIFTSFISTKSISTPPRLSNIMYASDFNKLYISKKGARQIFGIIETEYDNDDEMLKSIMAVKYSGFNLDCEQIKKSSDGATLVCDSDNGNYIVLARNKDENFTQWNDLTAKLRVK